MATGELVPADLYVQPPKALKLKAKSAFTVFVRQFPPEFFIEADVQLIVRYLMILGRLEQIDGEMLSTDDYITVNDLGTEAVHPLMRVYDMMLNQALKLGAVLQVIPPVRIPLIKEVGPGLGSNSSSRQKLVRLLYKYTDEETAEIVDASGAAYAGS